MAIGIAGQRPVPAKADQPVAEPADIGLALAADVEQAAWKATATASPVKMKLVA